MKTFREYDQSQLLLFPPSLDEWLPEDHLARFVSDIVESTLDLREIDEYYAGERGNPPYDPRLMVKLLVYGYATGVRSGRKIAKKCVEDIAFRYLCAGNTPDFRTISRFRKTHARALAGLFEQSLALCQKAGMVKMGRVALDGTKLLANASRHKAMSYGRMTVQEREWAKDIQQWMDDVERNDAHDDALYGEDKHGEELPDAVATKVKRLEFLRKAKQELEEEAREKARAEGKPNPEAAVPKDKAQKNFTDPQSKIMKTSDGSFHQCYNAQAVVDEEHQVIIAAAITTQASDVQQLVPMVERAERTCGKKARTVLADAGYWSDANMAAMEEREQAAYIATGRMKHGEEVDAAPRGRIPAGLTRKERMARMLRTKAGSTAYRRRKAIVEPVFGQMQTRQHAKRLLLRGKAGAELEWHLLSAGHNLLKLFQTVGRAGLPTLSPS